MKKKVHKGHRLFIFQQDYLSKVNLPMARKEIEEEEYPNTQTYGSDHYDTDDDVYSDDDAQNKAELYQIEQDSSYEDNERTITQYAYIKIGITELVVSSDGHIRKMDDMISTSYGFALPGTPYRTYSVQVEKHKIEEYFVHDIIWRAFHGEPPSGWEVRHNMWEAKTGKECYSNALDNLQIYPSTVTYLPSVRKCLPDAYH